MTGGKGRKMSRNAENETAAKGTLRKKIRNYIQQQIASGRFQAGDRIVETQLARELNVSQAPVREAILELAAMGLLEERPYSDGGGGGGYLQHPGVSG